MACLLKLFVRKLVSSAVIVIVYWFVCECACINVSVSVRVRVRVCVSPDHAEPLAMQLQH